MAHKNETRWLCENAKTLEKFSGQWVLFSANDGLVKNGGSLLAVLKGARKCKSRAHPFVFHVPSKTELEPVLPALAKH